MARIPRLLLQGESATYHVISRSALPGFFIGEVEKDYLLALLRRLSRVYFVEVLGFCLMGSHAHVVVRMHPGEGVDDDEMRRRYLISRGRESVPELLDGQIPWLREKWASLSEFVKGLTIPQDSGIGQRHAARRASPRRGLVKKSFSRWYNRTHGRSGFFWGERFTIPQEDGIGQSQTARRARPTRGRVQSVIVEDGDSLLNLLAYVELNPVRAGIVQCPEDYRWSSLGYHLQTGNQEGFLSLNLGLRHLMDVDDAERRCRYRRFVYEVGSVPTGKGATIAEETIQAEERRGFAITGLDRFRCRTRYFTDSGVIGTKQFVSECYRRFEACFACKHPKRPQPVAGIDGVFSLKRLRQAT